MTYLSKGSARPILFLPVNTGTRSKSSRTRQGSKGGGIIAKRFLEVAAQSAPDLYLRWVGFLSPAQKADLYTADFKAELSKHDANDRLSELFGAAATRTTGVLDTLAVDVNSYLPYDLLVKMDIATMANSLEARSPLLDHKVMEFAARLPAAMKVKGRSLKYLLRKYAENLLPPAALNRRKMGFGVPVGEWMKTDLKPLVDDTLLSDRAAARGYLRPEGVRTLVNEHQSGRHDHSGRLWALLCLELCFPNSSIDARTISSQFNSDLPPHTLGAAVAFTLENS